MNYLVDTNVISAISPSRSARSADLVEWIERRSDHLFLSVVTAAEVGDGIAKAARTGATKQAAGLKAWWDAIEHLYGNRILPFDLEAATIAGQILDFARAQGRAPGFADCAIAATARARDLTLLTRNVRHFEGLGTALFDPFEGGLPD